jgi:hypothetical protein
VTGLAGERRDLDESVGDLGNLQREELADGPLRPFATLVT